MRSEAGERIASTVAQRPLVGLALGLLVGLICLPLLSSSLFHGFERKTVDWRMRLRGQSDVAPEVAVCAIDARSVDRLGQWPWPRSTLAELIGLIAADGARTIALDIVFSEPSRAGSDEDRALAAAMESAGNVVPGFYLTSQLTLAEPQEPRPLPVEMAMTPPAGFPQLPSYGGIESNIPLLTRAAPAGGHFVVVPDEDGTTRHYSLILDHDGEVYPALALRAVQNYLGSPPIEVRPVQGRVPSVRLGDLVVPTSEKGELWINFRGSFGSTFPYHPAVDVLEGKVPPGTFENRIVFIGATETGIGDLSTSPFDVTVPGVEIHATVADNLLHARFIRNGAPETLLGILALLLIAPLGGWAATALREPRVGVVVFLGLIGGYLLVSYSTLALFNRHVALFVPVMATVLAYAVGAVWRNRFAEARAREIRKTFSQFVSEAVVHEMLADPGKVRLGGEKRELTVLFSDIRGFTSLSEKLSPEAVVSMLNEYLTPMTRIVLDEGGTLDKYMGDAIMAFFGAPVAMPDHARRACSAALAMRERMKQLSESWSGEGHPRISSGFGIHTGPMSVGNMGSDMIFDYTVIGDNVNLGSRLEGLTRLYAVDIVVSNETRGAAGEEFLWVELDRVRVKGKQQPVVVFELLGRAGTESVHRAFVEPFSRALGSYRSGNFDDAEKQLRTAARARPDDGPARLYLERIVAFRRSPPPDGWDGVTTLTAK